jgi:hypothetical protein
VRVLPHQFQLSVLNKLDLSASYFYRFVLRRVPCTYWVRGSVAPVQVIETLSTSPYSYTLCWLIAAPFYVSSTQPVVSDSLFFELGKWMRRLTGFVIDVFHKVEQSQTTTSFSGFLLAAFKFSLKYYKHNEKSTTVKSLS